MIKLDNVSKFYASEEAVAIGLNKVSVELNIGEFVAVTGESGSGKSTFLNVISGIDSYEDGEMTVNGEETSGFLQSDWEKYRNDYISFIFQDYNIIDSYTVYQNVEIALMSRFPDKSERKKQALALIDKVGLSSHVKHKGTELSGGQKQRVVIARALAKDSPIIMADEPTGNLDSNTGKEIMALLAEMSKDRLVIVVTHNYEQAADYATRKLRFFDGEIVEDVKVRPYAESELKVARLPNVKASKRALNVLGIAVNNVFATPKKLVFITALFLLCSFALMMSVPMYTEAEMIGVTKQSYIFSNVQNGRLVVKRGDDGVLTAADKAYIEEVAGADNVYYTDILLDCAYSLNGEEVESEDGYPYNEYFYGTMMPYEFFRGDIIKGRLPQADNEVFIVQSSDTLDSLNAAYGKTISSLSWNTGSKTPVESHVMTVVGYAFASDDSMFSYNSTTMYVTENVCKQFFVEQRNVTNRYNYNLDITTLSAEQKAVLATAMNYTSTDSLQMEQLPMMVSLDETLNDGEIKVNSRLAGMVGTDVDLTLSIFSDNTKTMHIVGTHESTDTLATLNVFTMNGKEIFDFIYPNGDTRQASLFVEDAKQDKVISTLREKGYYANRTYVMAETDTIMTFIKFIYVGLFVIVIFVLYLILSRVMRNVILSKKKDYVIMRSIGIEKKNINFILLLELAIVAIASVVISTALVLILRSTGSKLFTSLYDLNFGHIVLVLFGMLALVALMTRKFCRTMFNETVKGSLKNKD